MNVDEWFENYVHDRHDLFYKLAQGAQPDEVEPVYWCPKCCKNVEVHNTDYIPRCVNCGTVTQWHYIYRK